MDERKLMRKARLAYAKFLDKAVGKEEREAIKTATDRLLNKHGYQMDWKTGNVSKAGSQQQEAKAKQAAGSSKKADSKSKAKASTAKKQKQEAKMPERDGYTTNDLLYILSAYYGQEWTGKNLRRRIRQMDKWNDGKMTHYRFTDLDIDEILAHIGIHDNSWREVFLRKEA